MSVDVFGKAQSKSVSNKFAQLCAHIRKLGPKSAVKGDSIKRMYVCRKKVVPENFISFCH